MITEPLAKRELKTCELCGALFVRDMPVSAKLGEKHCAACVLTGPTAAMIEKDNGRSFRSFRVVGCKFRD